jgi:hypothetical protein
VIQLLNAPERRRIIFEIVMQRKNRVSGALDEPGDT